MLGHTPPGRGLRPLCHDHSVTCNGPEVKRYHLAAVHHHDIVLLSTDILICGSRERQVSMRCSGCPVSSSRETLISEATRLQPPEAEAHPGQVGRGSLVWQCLLGVAREAPPPESARRQYTQPWASCPCSDCQPHVVGRGGSVVLSGHHREASYPPACPSRGRNKYRKEHPEARRPGRARGRVTRVFNIDKPLPRSRPGSPKGGASNERPQMPLPWCFGRADSRTMKPTC